MVYLLNDQHTCCPACQFYSPAARLCITVDACLADAHAAGVDADTSAAPPPPPPAGAAPAAQPAYVQSLAGALADAPFIRVAAAPAAALAPAAGAARGPSVPAPALAPALPPMPAPAGQPQPGPVQPPSSLAGQPPAAEQHLGSRLAPAPAPLQASTGWPAPGPSAEVNAGRRPNVAQASAPAQGPALPSSAAAGARASGSPDEAAPAPGLAPPLAARRGAAAPAVPDLAAPAGPPLGAGAPLGAALRPLQAGYGGTVPLGGAPGGYAPASLGPAPARATAAAVQADTHGGGINVRISLPAAHWGRYAGPVLAAVAAAPQVAALEDAAGAAAPGLRHP